MRPNTNFRIFAVMLLIAFSCVTVSAQPGKKRQQQPHSIQKRNSYNSAKPASSQIKKINIPTIPKYFPLPQPRQIPKNILPITIKCFDKCEMDAVSVNKMMTERKKSIELGDTLHAEALLLEFWKNEGLKGNAHAQYYYGLSLLNKSQSEHEQNEAIHWITMAAKNGCQNAARRLSSIKER